MSSLEADGLQQQRTTVEAEESFQLLVESIPRRLMAALKTAKQLCAANEVSAGCTLGVLFQCCSV